MNTNPATQLSTALCSELQKALGAPFASWTKKETGWCIDNETLPEPFPEEDAIHERLVREQIGSEAITWEASDGRIALVVPFRKGRQARVAAGLVPRTDDRLVQQLGSTIRLLVEQRLELEVTNSKLNEYTFQVTNDFEELVWLRNLAEMIEICELDNNILHVAQKTLPTLRLLIQAEAVFLFGMPAPEDMAHGVVVGPLQFSDGNDVPENRARQLIDQLNIATAPAQPMVRNATSRTEFLCDIEGLRNCVLIRLFRRGTQSGWLMAVNKMRRAKGEEVPMAASALSQWEFGTFEAGLVNAAGIMLATHSRNIELFREKETLLVGVIRALINAIDAKDAYTCGHSDRVAEMSKRLAQELGLSDAECERIYLTGMLHDIGKIGIPDRVLDKPDKLTDEEYAVIKTHPGIGYEILKHLEPLQYVLPGVLHHHEMVNGRGYPHGLCGEDIPLVGRIIAVADAYDAMTSNRPYRKGMAAEKAEGILRAGAGKQWDNAVVNAFFTALPDIYAICGRDAVPDDASPSDQATTLARSPTTTPAADNVVKA